MKKLDMQSLNVIDNRLSVLNELFPECVTEGINNQGEQIRGFSIEKLRQMLSSDALVEKEQYIFSWVGKNQSIAEANTPVKKALRPCINCAGKWNNTENVYIEGDNLDALKLLQEAYLGAVKVIYIDPPYNTGNDFVYRDNFSQSVDAYESEAGAVDDEGNRLLRNVNSNGRFHSDWCSMIFPRLLLARELLANEGVIFISVDDHEQQNLKKMCDEVFGEDNFLAQIVWERAYSPVNLKKQFSECHDYILCYAKNISKVYCNGLPRSGEANERYSNPDNYPRGPWKSSDLSVGPVVQSKVYEITTPSGRKVLPPSGYCWRLDRDKFQEYVRDNRIWFGDDGNNVPSIKRFLGEVKQGMTPMTIWKYSEVGHSQEASQSLKKLFDGKAFFDYPKPVKLIKRCIQLYSDPDSTVLDFFSGSATTAHAVMELNAEDGGHRKFIMVQLPEPCDEKSEAYKAGYKNICEIGEERIRRAAKKIHEDHPDAEFDDGFRVFKVDSSNMKDVYYSAEEYSQTMLAGLESNIKDDRTDLDLLFGCLVDWGVPISLPYTSEKIDGCTVHDYNDGDLIACFDEEVSESVVKAIAKRQPLRVVFRDSSFANSPAKINVEEIFKLLSPDTSIKVI